MSFPEDPPPSSHGDWKAALAEFAGARLELVRLEARDAGRFAAKRLVLLLIAALSGTMAWLLLMAGLLGWTTAMTGWPWWACSLLLGTVHLPPALIALALLRRPAPPAFPVTRSELQKDREWLLSLQPNPRSKR
ncbi:MAG: phage holin family protein [Akkermansiaceae bacterium]|nr:phage holin family protein [Akkermansiaceae bacterium]